MRESRLPTFQAQCYPLSTCLINQHQSSSVKTECEVSLLPAFYGALISLNLQLPDSIDQAIEPQQVEDGRQKDDDEVDSKEKKRTRDDEEQEQIPNGKQAKLADVEEEEEESKSKLPSCLLQYLGKIGFDLKWAGGDQVLEQMENKWNECKIAEAEYELANSEFHTIINTCKSNAYQILARTKKDF